jgi:DNA-binding protein YbaB
MFSKLKQFKDMQSQAKTLQNQLSEENVVVENGGIKLVMSGNQKITSITIDSNLTATDIEKIIPDLFDEALRKIQKIMVEKFQSGNFNLPSM